MSSLAVIDAGHARVKTQTAFFLQVGVPFSGSIAMPLRRRISAQLNARARQQHQGTRQVSVLVLQRHVLVSLAGTREATTYWLEQARLARLLADVAAEVQRLDPSGAPSATTPAAAQDKVTPGRLHRCAVWLRSRARWPPPKSDLR